MRHRYRRNPFDVTPALILERLRERIFAGVVYAKFECMAEQQDCTRVGNKNPEYVKQFSLLHRLYPTQAKCLCIVRDGRDVALSITKTRWGLSSSYTAAKACSDSLADLVEIRRHLGPDRLHVLSYENLLQRPRETMEAARDFLGVPHGEAKIDEAVAEISGGKRPANYKNWKQEMSAVQRQRL